MRGGSVRAIGGINPVARSNVYARPAVPTMGVWDKVKKFVKDNKLVSRGLKAVGGVVVSKYSPLFSAGSSLAESHGWGRRKGRRQMGGSSKVVRF